MRFVRLPIVIAIMALVLAACAGGPVRNVFPPRASIQQITIQADGNWKVVLRLQNFSNVSATFDKVDAKIEIAGDDAGTVSIAPGVRIGPESAEPVEATLKPSAMSGGLFSGLKTGNVRYKISGRIVTSNPGGDYPYTYEDQLSAVPGVEGVFR